MPMQRVGNTNYYVIEANVPQPLDSRGRGYGLLVSDQRWKVWDEISKMVAADLKSMGATDDEVRKAHYQEQRLLQTEISQMRRDRNAMMSAAIKADAATDAKNATASATGGTWKKAAPKKVVYQPYDEQVPDGIGGVITVHHPERTVITSYDEIPGTAPGVVEVKGGGGGKSSSTKSEPSKTAQEAFAPKLEDLDRLIKEKEAELDAMKKMPVGRTSATPQKDFLTQVQERYAAQMGYGGFGLPKSARPAIDYNVGAGQLESLLKKAEDDAVKAYAADVGVGPLDPREVETIKREARAKEFDNIANFFGPKEVPVEGPKYNLPLGEGDLGVRGGATVLPEAKSRVGLRDLFSFDRGVAPETAPTSTSTFLPPASTSPATTVPTTTASPSTVAAPAGVRDVSMSPEAIAARSAANERERLLAGTAGRLPGFNERQAAFDILGMSSMPDVTSPTSQPASPSRVAPTLEDVQMQRQQQLQNEQVLRQKQLEDEQVLKQKQGFQDLQNRLKEATAPQPPKPPMKPITPGLPGAPETGAKMSVPARRDAYALAVVEGGAKLAAQPKKFERLAKTNLPQTERAKVVAPFVAMVDKLYSTNAGKADAFNATYNEISRFYANAPDTRKQAHEYLIAKDILVKNETKPA